jgi:RsmE family RNA methyltransferase
VGAPQFFVEPADLTDEVAVVRGDEARHAAGALRLRVGERLLVADGAGRVAEATAAAVGRGEVRARVEAVREVAPRRPALTVVAGLVKGGKLDLVVQKLTELGVERVAPAACRRSMVDWDARKRAVARDRWAAIALAAAKQCRRDRVPVVAPVDGLAAQVAAAPAPAWSAGRRAASRCRRPCRPPRPTRSPWWSARRAGWPPTRWPPAPRPGRSRSRSGSWSCALRPRRSRPVRRSRSTTATWDSCPRGTPARAGHGGDLGAGADPQQVTDLDVGGGTSTGSA